MGKFFDVKTKDGQIYNMAIQAYEVGLYVCAYQNGNMVEQFGTKQTEEEFMKEMSDIIIS